MSKSGGRVWTVLAAALLLLGVGRPAASFPVNGYQTVLPTGSELGEDAIEQPREVFHSEAIGGRKSYLIKLGDMAFSSPYIFGGPARRASMSCSSCHVNGANNAKFYIPGMSSGHGNFDTTGPFFNPPADNGVQDPVTIPSLRGARYLAPYGHDGRFASLRDFVHNVIVNEFAGPEPSPAVLDAIVIYIQDIDFLPDPLLGPAGRLTPNASAAARRGEALFMKPFPHDPTLSCATCHVPSGAFVDHRLHDVGSGGFFKTPTLLNSDFNAPYFHDGRYQSLDQVVAHFDRTFALHLTRGDQQDIVAYLKAVGDGVEPYQADGVDPQLKEISDFSSVLATAIPARNTAVIALATETVGTELREFGEHFPGRTDSTVSGGRTQRAAARATIDELVLSLRRVEIAASAGNFADAQSAYANYNAHLASAAPILHAAEPWSLYNPVIHDAHYAALRQMIETARKSPP